MKKVLVFEGLLHDVVPVGTEFPVAPGMQWVDAPDDVSAETHLFNGTAITPKPAKTTAQLEAEQSVLAKAKLAKLQADIFPDLLAFVANLTGAPQSIKDAAAMAAAEKAKIKQ